MSITIKDIANRLDLNFSSVSRALNNKPGVSESTRELVIRTAKEMGYHPNTLARGLVSRKTNTIGVIMPDIINPVFGAITTGVIETANSNDYDVFICVTNWSEEKEAGYIYALMEKQVDGIIVKSVSNANSKLLANSNIPLVGFESWMSTHDFSSVSTDNVHAGRIAAEHFISCGYKHPALIPGPENSSAAIFRCDGFRGIYREKGMEFDESRLLYSDYNIEAGYTMAGKMLEKYPDTDSILAGNDVIAIGVLQYLAEHNIKAGKSFGVIGFDNITFAGLPHIELTTIKQPKYSIGRLMTNLILEEINNEKKGIRNFAQRILLEPELIIRNTTCRKRKK